MIYRQVVNGIGNSLEKVVIVPFCSHAIQENQLEGKEISLKTFLEKAKGNTSIEYEQVIFLLYITCLICFNFLELSTHTHTSKAVRQQRGQGPT